jgi:hypothetical protein
VDLESVSGYLQAMQHQENPDAADKCLAVRFYYDEFEDAEASKKAGRPMFKSEECVEIRAPGNADVRMGRIKYMKPDPRERFPAAYAKFKAGERIQVVGTPLKSWGLITAAAAKSYAAIGIYSVEQLAGLSDTNAQEIMGSIADRQKARDFLATAKGLEPAAEARAEAEKLRAELAVMRDVVRQQGDKIESLIAQRNGIEEPAPKRRGRPPKAEETDA